MKTNIALISLINDFGKELSRALSEQLDLYTVDVADFMAFNMIDDEKVITTCGADYLLKLQQKTVCNVAAFEDTVITLHGSLFMNSKNMEELKKSSLIVYLQVSENFFNKLIKKEYDEGKKKALMTEALVLSERNKHCEKNSDIIINIESLNAKNICKKLMKRINDFYTKK